MPTFTMPSTFSLIAYGVCVLILGAFLLLAFRDIALLFAARGNLKPGLSRVWAVARTAIFEALAARVWAVPILWFAACFIINLMVNPFDEQDRIGIYLRVLLTGQEILALIILGILAAFSFPRERERRTIINTASKPLSRLEFFLGKVVGFSAVGAGLLVFMGLITWGYLYIADYRVRTREAAAYAKQVLDYGTDPRIYAVPSEGLKRRAEEGVLAARNFITPRSMQIAGMIEYGSGDQPRRFLKGGSQQRILYHFPALLGAPRPAPQPLLYFLFTPIAFQVPGMPPQVPDKIQINVSAGLQRRPSETRETTLTLQRDPTGGSSFYAFWDPSEEGGQIFGYYNPADPAASDDLGPVEISVSCPTKGIMLPLYDTATSNENVAVQNVVMNGKILEQGGIIALATPEIIGFEKNDLQQIEGPGEKDHAPPEVASFRFKAADLDNVPINTVKNTFTVTLNLDLEKTSNQSRATIANITAYNRIDMNSRDKIINIERPIEEKRATEVELPTTLLPPIDAKTGRRVENADLFIDLRCLVSGHWIGANVGAVRIEQPPSFFFINLLKSELVIFCEVVLLVLIAVAAGIRLGGPVAVLVTIMAYLLASLFTFVHEQIASGGESLFSAPEQQMLAGNWIYRSGTIAQAAALKLAYLFINMLPDFTRYQPLDFIVQSRNMPWSVLGLDALWTLIYALPFIALGYLLIRKQELA